MGSWSQVAAAAADDGSLSHSDRVIETHPAYGALGNVFFGEGGKWQEAEPLWQRKQAQQAQRQAQRRQGEAGEEEAALEAGGGSEEEEEAGAEEAGAEEPDQIGWLEGRGPPRLTAAIPVENPDCSCRLTWSAGWRSGSRVGRPSRLGNGRGGW